MPPRRRSRLVAEAARDAVELRRDVVDLRRRIQLFFKRRAIAVTAMDYADLQRERVDLQRRIKLLTYRLDELDAKYDAIDAAGVHTSEFDPSPPPSRHECCWEHGLKVDISYFDGGLKNDCRDALYDTSGIFIIDGPEMDLPPSSGNPIYDDYADDEVDFSPNLGDSTYDIYGADDVDIAPNFDNPIFDDYGDEEVVEEYVTEPVIPVLLLQQTFFAPRTHDTSMLQPSCTVGGNVCTFIADAETSITIFVRVLSHDTSVHMMLDKDDFTCFLVLRKRHSTFGWKPGWSSWRGFDTDSASDSRTNLFCPGEDDAD